MGTFLTVSLFIIGDSVFQPLLLMLQLFQFLFVAGQVFPEQLTLRVLLIHFKISFQFFCWDSRNAAQGEPLSGMHMTQKSPDIHMPGELGSAGRTTCSEHV